jgi:ABC-2 type transport system ATP-binding protein
MIDIIIDNISKYFGKVNALTNINFEVNNSEIFGLIGPDGAGKTTLFRIINTLYIPDEGKATVLGLDTIKDYKKIRVQLGYMPGRFSLYQDLSVEENLTFFASIFGTTIKENYYLIEDIYSQIEPFKDRKAGALSGGMKQKLALSCALIHKPKILLLDEPTTGVDAVSRKEFWEMLKKLKEQGITIVVSTPYMDEAELCDKVALLQKGRILNIDTPQNIVSGFSKKLIGINASNKYALINVLRAYEHCDTCYPFGEYVHYTDNRGEPNKNELLDHLTKNGLKDIKINDINPDIEDSFMELMVKE